MGKLMIRNHLNFSNSLRRFIANAFFVLFVSLLGINISAPDARAQRAPSKIIMPQNLQDTEVSLITVGLGTEVYMRYGHTLLKVTSGDNGREYVYNWGMFSFDDPMFPIKFFLGERKYWVGETSERFIVKLYRDYEDRNVYEQKVNLTAKQKERLISILNRNLSVENMFFNYEHFSSNCATKPRDFLDEALGGYIKNSLTNKSREGVTYRRYVRENMNMPPALGFLLDIVMSSDLEKKLSYWDETFYPPKLSEYVGELPAIGDDGSYSDKKLFGPANQLVRASSEHISSDYMFIKPFSYFFMALVFLWATLLFVSSRTKGEKLQRLKHVVSAATLTSWGFFSGLVGLIMALSWAVSTHYDMHHNVNLFIFNPLDFLLIGVGIKFLFKGNIKARTHTVLKALTALHILGWLVFFLGNLFGAFVQDVSRVALYLAPVQLVVWLLVRVEIRGSGKAVAGQGFKAK